MKALTIAERVVVIDEPSWKDMRDLQITLTKYPTMVGIVFVKPPLNNLMRLNKLKHNRIMVWLDQGLAIRESIITSTNQMITNRLELLSDVGLFRPKGIPECILPTPKFEQEQEKVGRGMTNPECYMGHSTTASKDSIFHGISTRAIVAKVKTELDEAMKGNMQ